MILETVVIAIIVLLLVTLIVKRFVYFRPIAAFAPTQKQYENIFDGNLHGWYTRGSSGFVILLCHGNGGNVSYFEEYIQGFERMNHSVLIFDYSGYGISKGVPSEDMLMSNGIQMYQYLVRQGYTKAQIIPVGISMGGPVATYIASTYSLPRLILISPLPSIKLVIQHKLPQIQFLKFLFPEFDTGEYLRPYLGKTLLVHSQEDDIIPYESTYELQKFCTTVIPTTGKHNELHVPWNHIEVWLINTYKHHP